MTRRMFMPCALAALTLAACYTTDGVLLDDHELRCNDGVLERSEPDGRGGVEWVVVEECTYRDNACSVVEGVPSCVVVAPSYFDGETWCSGDVITGRRTTGARAGEWIEIEDCATAGLFCVDWLDGQATCEPWPCQQEFQERTQLRVTSIQIATPEVLALGVFQHTLNSYIDDLQTQWLFDLDAHGTSLVGMGAPRGEDGPPDSEELCQASWCSEHPPVEATEVDIDEDLLVALIPSLPLRFCLELVGDS